MSDNGPIRPPPLLLEETPTMRRVLILCVALSLAATAMAADEPKPNTITPKEIADGWILLFDGETTFGWRSLGHAKGTAADGMLAPEGDKPGLLVTTSPFRDYELKMDYQIKNGSLASLFIACDAGGLKSFSKDDLVARFPGLPKAGWASARLNVRGGNLVETHFYSDDAGSGSFLHADHGNLDGEHSGHIALSGNGVVFRNIKLKPTNTKPLFNGKDLSGWKEFPGKKSKFSVTKDGNIHLEGGPGDLQTEGQWADFALQLDCISNGDHCNSGVFFRCIPGEFENGYEAQIRNEFKAEPTQEYTIEEYDPKTHELKGKKKEKYTAVDYGTGAIYRRAPARKELSKDREWFGMTIVANGRHIATWVNGVQAVDWTDERPTADNPRKGCRLEKGAISLQGHEAAVEDLDFRNIRIQDLAGAEEKKP